MSNDIESPVMIRVRELIVPIATDLGLDLYDLEQRGGTLRVTLETPPGSPAGITLDKLALASRLVSKELDQHDPIPSRYTLEVTSPGVERTLRNQEHFQREVGKLIAIRLADVPRAKPGSSSSADRRTQGVIVSADEHAVTLLVGEGDDAAEQVVAYTQIDRARTVFEWGPQPKPGQRQKPRRAAAKAATEAHAAETPDTGPAAPAASPAASSNPETGPRRSGAKSRFGTAAAPAASPAASSKEHST